jgi:hypothetical protein
MPDMAAAVDLSDPVVGGQVGLVLLLLLLSLSPLSSLLLDRARVLVS